MGIEKYKLHQKKVFPYLVPLTNINLRNKVIKCQLFM